MYQQELGTGHRESYAIDATSMRKGPKVDTVIFRRQLKIGKDAALMYHS